MAERKNVLSERKIQAISFDTEPTLICGKQQKNALWESILEEHFSEEFAHYCHQQFHQWRHRNYLKQLESGQYPSLKELYEVIMKEIIEENQLAIDFDRAMAVLKDSMLSRPLQDDVGEVLFEELKVPTFVISIGTKDWLPSNLLKLPFEDVILSDEYSIPKYHDMYSLFNKAVEEHGVKPENWLHISTQYSDLIYADKHGLQTCWLNREGEFWNHLFHPTYEISSLEALKNILK